MPPAITVFWIEMTDDEARVLDRVAREHHAKVVEARMYSLAALAYAARAEGAVVFVARTPQDATRALGLGVDEVIRAGEITEDSLRATLAFAVARAEARTSYELRRGVFQDDDDLALAALVAAFGRRLAEPIEAASVGCEMLESALGVVLDVDEKFIEWTIRAGPLGQARDLAVRRLASPSSRELLRALAQVRKELDRAGSLVSAIVGLASHAECSHTRSIAQLVRDVVQVMSADYSAWATFDVEATGSCKVAVPPLTVAFVLSALLVNAVDAIRARRNTLGRVLVRVSEHEDTVLLEVEDNGRPIPTDLRPSALEPYFAVARADRTGLVRVRERMRRCGGDVQVDSGEVGTTVRVLIPTSSDDVTFAHAAADVPVAVKKDRHN